MASLAFMPQTAFSFPQALTERYQPKTINDFIGLEKPRKILSRLASNPFASAWMLSGPSGTGKTTMALALAAEIKAEIHHIPSQKCTLDMIETVRRRCQYVPQMGCAWHLVIVDEADMMSQAAQNALLSHLDGTNPPPQTIYVFTCNTPEKLEARFLSRTRQIEFSSYGIAKDAAALLETVWSAENGGDKPNFARIVKESNNNVRESLMKLETELMAS